MSSKSWYTSKTIWVNILTLVVSVGAQLTDSLPPALAAKLVSVVAVANILLRFATDKPLGGKPKSRSKK